MDSKIVEFTQKYLAQGLPVFPCCDAEHKMKRTPEQMERHMKLCRCPGKAPLVKWSEWTQTTGADLGSWIRLYGEFNLGMRFGGVTGYIGVDVDGDEGEQLWMATVNGRELPETWEFKTGNGRRLVFAIPLGMKTKKFSNKGEGVHQEAPILADGQFSVMPPSKHHTGTRYEWLQGRSPWEMDCAQAPQWMIELVREESIAEKKNMAKVAQASIADKKKAETLRNIGQSETMANEEYLFGMPFSSHPPEANLEKKEVTKGKAASTKGWKEMQHTVVSEGGRDNALTTYIGSLCADPGLRAAGKAVISMMAHDYNQKCLVPPIENEMVEVKIERFWESEEAKSAEYAALQEEGLSETTLIQPLRNRLDELGLTYVFEGFSKTDSDSYYCTNSKGPWVHDEDDVRLKNIIIDLCKDLGNPGFATARNLENVVKQYALQAKNSQKRTRNLFQDDPRDELIQTYLPVGGQLLDWVTGDLHPWKKEFLSPTNFDVEYDPEATCPSWEQYLREWLPEKAVRDFLQEWCGYAMLAKPDKEPRFVVLLGGGSNGKSMFADTIHDLFGDAVASQSLESLASRFGPAMLKNKRMNIVTEVNAQRFKNTGTLKQIVSGERLEVERKGKDFSPVQFVCSLLFCTNVIPKFEDTSDGFARRFTVVKFEQKFVPDPLKAREMKKNLKAERAGIFNWLLEGLRRASMSSKYALPISVQEASEDAQNEGQYIKQFCDLFLKPIDGYKYKTKAHIASDFQARYGEKKHGIGVTFAHEVFMYWYSLTVGDAKFAAKQKSFEKYLVEKLGVRKERYTTCVSREGKSYTYLGLDFTYSPDMNCHVSDIRYHSSYTPSDSFEILAKYCESWEENGYIEKGLVPKTK